MTQTVEVTRTTPRYVTPEWVRDEALDDLRWRVEDLSDLLPPTGAHMTTQTLSHIASELKRVTAGMNRLAEAQSRVDGCEVAR